MADTGDIIRRKYTGFRGVDLRGDEVNLVRSPDSKNVWRNYKKTSSIETRPKLALHTKFDAEINGIYFFRGNMLVHSGTKLYIAGTESPIYSELNNAKSCGFVYDDKFYIIDGKNYLQYDGTQIKAVEGYVPTTYISRVPLGGGKKYQDVNMLTPRRINTFRGDGKSKEYYVDSTNIDSIIAVKVENRETGEMVKTTAYTEYLEKGMIKFTTAPGEPLTTGQDNVSIEFTKKVTKEDGDEDEYRKAILSCTMIQLFDNRVFFSGNPNKPNYVYHCSLNDPTYFSDLDYYREGMDEAKITGIAAGNNALWVFREPSDANTNVFYHIPALDDEYGKIYPSSHSSISLGCVGKAINFGDDIVFFSPRGMEGISGDITTEQMAAHRSTVVDRRLTDEANYSSMLLEEYEGYLFVIIGKNVYLADSRSMFQNENHYEYEWYYWEFDKEITCTRVYEGMLYLGTKDGVYSLSDTESDVPSYWVTPKDKFEAPHKQKTTNKKGCVVEALGNVTISVKTDKDEDFEELGTFENISDYFAVRIKKKKWKDIQLKFHSDKRFSLESATLEAFIGGYIKR